MKNNVTTSKKIKIVLLIGVLFALVIILLGYNRISKMAVDGWSTHVTAIKNSHVIDNEAKEVFLHKKKFSTSYRYEYLFKYFLYGNYKYQSPEGAFVYYPGQISSRGRKINGLEGFARFFPLAASWLNSGRSDIIVIHDEKINLIEILKKGLINGTNPENIEYWGQIEDKDQRIVEAADIALALWLSMDYIWLNLTLLEKNQIVEWLNQSINKTIVDNNWNLFPITTVKVLEKLGYKNENHLDYINKLYKNYKTKHYLGEGWFDDPPKGIDYYNAWSIHYSLFWLDQIDPTFDQNFIRQTHAEFVKFYKYLFSPKGFPIMGRSVCYRLAAPAPLISAALIAPDEISIGLALRSLDATWFHFISNDALKKGELTQGYYDADLSLLDSYSGTGSCLWSLRSLIMAFYVDKQLDLFVAKEEPFPVEQSDFEIKNNTIGWTLKGDYINQKIKLIIDKNINNEIYKLKKYSIKNKIKEKIFKRPYRPDNEDALYKNYIYTNEACVIKEL